MIPQKFHAGVDVDSDQGYRDKSKEHLEHSRKRRLVEYVFSCTLVHKLQHFMSCDVPICMANAPFEALKVHLPLNFADNCHMRLGDDEIRGSLEAKLFINVSYFSVVSHLCKEGGINVLVNSTDLFVQLYQILVFWE